MRVPKPKKRPSPKSSANASNHPLSLPGQRWIPSAATTLGNFLQLQSAAGNRALADYLRGLADPAAGASSALKTYRAARRDGIVPDPTVDGAPVMAERDPRYGDWQFRFAADPRDGGTAFYWITLNRYKNRERHVLIDAETNETFDSLGADLDEAERESLLEWAQTLLREQLTGKSDASAARASNEAAGARGEDEEDETPTPLSDDGSDDEDGG